MWGLAGEITEFILSILVLKTIHSLPRPGLVDLQMDRAFCAKTSKISKIDITLPYN